MFRSIRTVKADLAQAEHGFTGEGVVWAIVGTGIDATHSHFQPFKNLDLPSGLHHYDFSSLKIDDYRITDVWTDDDDGELVAKVVGDDRLKISRPVDLNGQCTRLAGIIAGQGTLDDGQAVRGIAPAATILSIGVLDEAGTASTTELKVILALKAIQYINSQHGAPLIQGVLLPVSIPWDARNFACGHTPVCSEVERTINSGVVVVTVSGNVGFDNERNTVLEGGITDPGNAELAITVGSTHRTLPELYGASFFSCRGPTSDGRQKPDLLAPGERLYTAEATIAKTIKTGRKGSRTPKVTFENPSTAYSPYDGTSLAAAHVSGAAAGLLALRRNLIGKPHGVKDILRRTAVDLKRLPMYQGAGLLDVQAAARDALGVTAPVALSSKPPVKMFCSYSHKDIALFTEFQAHLAPMERTNRLRLWSDTLIEPGKRWRKEIYDALETADIIVLLVSAYFFESDFCYSIEFTRALEREKEGTARIVPVKVRPVTLKGTVIGEIQSLPPGGRPISLYQEPHQGWAEVGDKLFEIVEKLRA